MGGAPEAGCQCGPARLKSPPVPGALDGGFRFSLSDGEHSSAGHFFRMAQKHTFSLEGSRTLDRLPMGEPRQGPSASPVAAGLALAPGQSPTVPLGFR